MTNVASRFDGGRLSGDVSSRPRSSTPRSSKDEGDSVLVDPDVVVGQDVSILSEES